MNFSFPTARSFVLLAVLSSASVGYCQSSPPKFDQSDLIATLTAAETAKADKAITCKRLAVFGDDQCVPAVAELLTDPELTSWARITLEAIATPDAQSALIAAIDQTEGLSLVGIINSLGVLRAPASVEPLAEKLKSEDELVAASAAVSLGKVGGDAVETTLLANLNDPRDAVRSAVAEGLVLAAEHSLSEGDAVRASELYDSILAADVPPPRMVEATRGAIISRGTDGVTLLVEKLGSDNERIRFVALSAARQIQGDRIVDALKKAVENVPAAQKPLFLIALGDRGDASFIETMLAAIKSNETEVRLAAIGMLQTIGDATCVETLLSAAADNVTPVAEAAKETLAQLDHPEIDAAIQSRLAQATGEQQVTLINLVGARRIDAVDYLLAAADDSDKAVRSAALAALGQVATLEQLPILIQRSTSSKQDTTEAMTALRAACVRMPDQAACAKILSDAMAGATPQTQLSLLETVAAMGGPDALAVLGRVATEGSTAMKDAATRLLGDWMSVDAGTALAAVAKQPTNPYRIRAARGYLRLVRQFVMAPPQRHEMVQAAMEFVDRTEEKELLLDAAGRYPSGFMLKTVVDLSSDPALADRAKSVGLSIARKIPGNPQVAKLLDQLGIPKVDLKILEASYGAGDQQTDVTEALQKAASDSPMVVLDKSNFSDAFGGDPAPGRPKFLSVKYTVDGKPATAMIRENMSIILDAGE
ncbi:HEAT repeat domain-containing protein [Neorhodopirellula pilleata]|uniref:HEAT repeat protein n=1 Tax=Neorhodopirellula pilleata TaxID=2714738 RepID=A0A5C6B0W2_9BACT|nr:HEAT repeat domain-containing protein [Neorhodopirellula pilleata]TWU04024.1 HEAT repeat protein [Neorhodopirellula pilleata]